jgi:hypothetical protein
VFSVLEIEYNDVKQARSRVAHWRGENLVLYKPRVHPDFVARFSPPCEGGVRGGGPGAIDPKVLRGKVLDRLVRTRASEKELEELKMLAVADAAASLPRSAMVLLARCPPPLPPPSQGGEKDAPASSVWRNKPRSGPRLMTPQPRLAFHHLSPALSAFLRGI